MLERHNLTPKTPPPKPAPTPEPPRVGQVDPVVESSRYDFEKNPPSYATSTPSSAPSTPSRPSLKGAGERVVQQASPSSKVRRASEMVSLQDKVQGGRGTVADAIKLNERRASN